MSKANDRLAGACSQVEALADEALLWCADSEALLGIECKSLSQHMQGFKLRTARLQNAIGRKPAVGLAGPCRSGKTHLAAGLAARGSVPLLSKFEGFDAGIDFLQQIRSDAARASGVVIRFSSDDRGTPAKFPVELSLLTLVDLIKILGTAYLSAAASEPVVAPTPAEIEAYSTRVSHQLSPFFVSGLSEQEIWSIRDYFERSFAGSSVIRALTSGGYWDYLGAMVPRLPQGGRLEMLSLLWGGLPGYTMLFDHAITALEKLGYEQRAYCSMASLAAVDPETGLVSAIPDSIMNVDPLFRIGKSDDEAVMVRSEHGAWASIGRGVLAALTREVRVCLRENCSVLLEQADLIEFPGLHLAGDFAGDWSSDHNTTAALFALFARHKAGHLFEDYARNHEITSLVVCVDPASRNISGLSQTVSGWAEAAHGRSAGERETIDTGLFVVLTMLDQAIPKSNEEDIAGVDWTARINAALEDGVGWGAGWPREWTPGRPFDQVYLLRSPHHKAPELCDYLGNGLELCIKSSRINHVSIARDRFLENETVQQHVADPVVAWQEALEPGDGGVSLLVQSIAGVCNELGRRRQITSELAGLRHAMGERLQRFYVSDDELAQQDLRRRSGQVVLRALQICSDKRLLGKIMRLLQVSESEFGSLYHNLETNPFRSDARNMPPSTLSERLTQSLKQVAGRGERKGMAQADGEAGLDAVAAVMAEHRAAHRAGASDGAAGTYAAGAAAPGEAVQMAQRYANAACEYWASKLRTIANAPGIHRRFGLSASALSFLVDELLAAAQRHDLRRELVTRINKSLINQAGMQQRTATAAIVAAELFSMFTNCLGFDQRWADHHPRRKGRAQAAIFSPRQETGLASISEVRARLGKAFFNDWSVAYMAMIEDNADYLRSTRPELKQEQQLGKLLGDLDPPEFWPAFRSVS